MKKSTKITRSNPKNADADGGILLASMRTVGDALSSIHLDARSIGGLALPDRMSNRRSQRLLREIARGFADAFEAVERIRALAGDGWNADALVEVGGVCLQSRSRVVHAVWLVDAVASDLREMHARTRHLAALVASEEAEEARSLALRIDRTAATVHAALESIRTRAASELLDARSRVAS